MIGWKQSLAEFSLNGPNIAKKGPNFLLDNVFLFHVQKEKEYLKVYRKF